MDCLSIMSSELAAMKRAVKMWWKMALLHWFSHFFFTKECHIHLIKNKIKTSGTWVNFVLFLFGCSPKIKGILSLFYTLNHYAKK